MQRQAARCMLPATGAAAADVPRVVAIFGVEGWRWDWVRDVHALVWF